MNISKISIAAATIIHFFVEVFKLLVPVLLFVCFVAVIRFIYLYQKHHYNHFDVFKKRNISKNIKKDIIHSMIKKLEGHFNVMKFDNLNSDLVVLDETGVYLIKMVLDYEGIICLNKEENSFYNYVNKNKNFKIENPFNELDKDINKLKGIKCHGIVVFDSNIILQLKYNGPYKISRITSIVYLIKSQMNDNKKIYKLDELDNISNKIRGI